MCNCDDCNGECHADCDEMKSPAATGKAGKVEFERMEFESWVMEQGFHLSKAIHRDYENSKINWMWKAWLKAKNLKI